MISFDEWKKTRDRIFDEAFNTEWENFRLQILSSLKIKTNMTDTKITSAYVDDKKKLSERTEEEVQLWMDIFELLDSRGYSLDPVLIDGKPEIKLIKDTE